MDAWVSTSLIGIGLHGSHVLMIWLHIVEACIICYQHLNGDFRL